MGSLAGRWTELSGQKNWKGLLDPLDVDLRRYIINYGDRAGALAFAFDNRLVSSVNCRGFSLYSPEEFFSKIGITNSNPYKYTVTKFIYSRSEIKFFDYVIEGESSWCAYVAVATNEGKSMLGRRDIVVAWRGTMLAVEWLEDAEAILVSASELFGKDNDPKVHYGFYSIYTAKNSSSIYNKTSAGEQILAEVRKLVDQYKDEEVSITVTGHSLGSAIATLNALDIAANGYNKPSGNSNKSFPVTAVVFGSPKVGDAGFKKVYDGQQDLRLLRVKNKNDPIPELPPIGYYDVGVELAIDTTKSPFLKESVSPHNLDVHLHGIAGSHGTNGAFKLVIDLDIALINRRVDGLKDDYNIPSEWWVEKNKGMVQQDDGTYKLLLSYVPEPPSV